MLKKMPTRRPTMHKIRENMVWGKKFRRPAKITKKGEGHDAL